MAVTEVKATDISVYENQVAADIVANRKKIDLIQQEPNFRRNHAHIAQRAKGEVYVDKNIKDYARIGFINQPGQIDFNLQKDAAAIAKYLLELAIEYPPSGDSRENFEKYLQEKSRKAGRDITEEELCSQLGLDGPFLHGRRIKDINEITHVVGIGDSGLPFLQAVGPLFSGARSVEVPKLKPGQESEVKDRNRIISAHSYSKNTIRHFDFPLEQIDKGSNVLLVDDVCANGIVSVQFGQFLLRHGINVAGLGVYFDKAHQGGLELFEAACGVPAVSVLHITQINSEKGTIEIAPLRHRRYDDGVRWRLGGWQMHPNS